MTVKRPVLFLHGWTMRGMIFEDVQSRMPEEFHCIAPDMPGHAGAAHLPATLDACADLIEDLLEDLSGNTILVGWSMGAAAAWRYIARYGTDRLAGLVTIDMSPKIVPCTGWPHGLKGQTAKSVRATTLRLAEDWEGAAQSITATMFATLDGAPGFDRNDALQLILSHDPDSMRALWKDMIAMDARQIIPQIDVPYLVCSGARSRVYPASASEWIAATAPMASRHIFSNSGHSPNLEESEEFVRVVSTFARSIDLAGVRNRHLSP